ATREHAVELPAGFALAEEHLARGEPARAGGAHERVGRAVVERREDRHVREQTTPVERTSGLARVLPIRVATRHGVRLSPARPQRGAKAAKSSSKAFIWFPCADDGTRMGVVTPAARQASTPSRTSFAVPKSVTSASQRSLISRVRSSLRPAATAFSMAIISST